MSFIKSLFLLLLIVSYSQVKAAIGVSVECKISPGSASFVAQTDSVKGVATLDENKNIVAEGVTVDLKSLTTSMSLRDDHMKNKYLEVEKFPEATLTMGKGKDGMGEGKIKVRGVEKEIKGTYKILDEKELQAQFDLNLSDFDIKGIRHLGIGVKDIVKVTVTVPLKK